MASEISARTILPRATGAEEESQGTDRPDQPVGGGADAVFWRRAIGVERRSEDGASDDGVRAMYTSEW